MEREEFIGIKVTKKMKDEIRKASGKEFSTITGWILRVIQKELSK